MFYMKRDPLPVFSLYGVRQFEEGEHHIHRLFDKSVLVLMLEGILRFEEDGEEVELTAGEYYIQRAGRMQTGYRISESPQYLFIHFSGFFSEDPADGLPIRGRCSTGTVRMAMEEYERHYRTHNSSFFSLNAVMFTIFADLEHGVSPDDSRSLIARDIKHYIAAEFATPLSLARIAARYGYSEDYTIRLFREHYGITPYQYMLKKRLNRAEQLLRESTKSVESISREVGYNDFSTFYRDFKKKYGVAPSELRNRK